MSEPNENREWAIEHQDSKGKKHRTEPLTYSDACVKYAELSKAQMPTMGLPYLEGDKWVVTLFYACEKDARAIHEQFLRAPPYRRRVKFIALGERPAAPAPLGPMERINRQGLRTDRRSD